MDEPKRGEIWRVMLGRRQRGTELSGQHPCLVVSNDRFNQETARITIVPMTTYETRREEVRSLWGVTITNSQDVDMDPKNSTYYVYHNGRKYPEDLRIWFDEQKRILAKSIIDCGQLWTIFKTSDADNELRWDRRHGELEDTPMIQVESALQVVIGGCIRFNRLDESELPYQSGDVLELDLHTSSITHTGRPWCLVVSSTAVDAIRERLIVKRRQDPEPRPLGHCTVVPLQLPPYNYNPNKDRGVFEVTVYPNNKDALPQVVLALCFEPYTIDWRNRNTNIKPVGSVHDEHMNSVRCTLREYLDLPM